jgi:hypothetical protein
MVQIGRTEGATIDSKTALPECQTIKTIKKVVQFNPELMGQVGPDFSLQLIYLYKMIDCYAFLNITQVCLSS